MNFKLSETGAFQTEFEFGQLSISGNSDIGFKPVQLIVSAIAGCSGGVFKKILEKKRIAYNGIEITADVERNPDEANRITKIAFHYLVDGENLQLEQLQKSLEIAFKNCAMAQSVKGAIEISETVSIKDQD